GAARRLDPGHSRNRRRRTAARGIDGVDRQAQYAHSSSRDACQPCCSDDPEARRSGRSPRQGDQLGPQQTRMSSGEIMTNLDQALFELDLFGFTVLPSVLSEQEVGKLASLLDEADAAIGVDYVYDG